MATALHQEQPEQHWDGPPWLARIPQIKACHGAWTEGRRRFHGFGALLLQQCGAELEAMQGEGGEDKDAGCFQRSSDGPMAASVHPEIHKHLWSGDKR